MLSTHTVHETQPPVVCRQTPVTEMNNHTEMQRQGHAMRITRYTKSHKDTSAVKLEHRHCAVTEAGGKPRPPGCAVTFLVTSAPMPHGHHIPMHSHTHIQVPWNTCTHTHPLTSMDHSGAQPAPDHPQSGHMDPRVAQSILHLLPAPPFSPSQGWSKSRTKAQCPLLPFPLSSPLPTPPPPASIPFVLLQLSLSGSPGRVAGTLRPGCQGCRQQDKPQWSVQEQQPRSARERSWPGECQVLLGT